MRVCLIALDLFFPTTDASQPEDITVDETHAYKNVTYQNYSFDPLHQLRELHSGHVFTKVSIWKQRTEHCELRPAWGRNGQIW